MRLGADSDRASCGAVVISERRHGKRNLIFVSQPYLQFIANVFIWSGNHVSSSPSSSIHCNVGFHYGPLRMHLRLVTSVWILTSSIAFAQANTLAPLPEHAAGSRSTFSKFKRRCPLPTEEDPNPPCRPPVEPPEPTDPSIHSYTVNDPGIFHKPISIKINVPDTISVETWNDVLDNLQTTLPTTLKQFNVDASQIPALASEGIPLLVEAITAVHNGLSLPDTDAALARRGLFSKIGRWIKKVRDFSSPQCSITSC